MEALWKVAISLTGVSGVIAFVIWSLYKEWLKVPLLKDLTRLQKYNLLKLFLILTFSFAALGLFLSAYKYHLDSKIPEASINELESKVESRYAYGKMKIDGLLNSQNLSPEDQLEAEKLKKEYSFYVQEAKDALEKKQFNKFHDLTNQLNELLRSKKIKKLLPDVDPREMCWEPNTDQFKDLV